MRGLRILLPLLAGLLLPLLSGLLLPLSVGAAGAEDGVGDSVSLPKEITDLLPENAEEALEQGDPASAVGQLGPDFLLHSVGEALKEALRTAIAPFLTLLGVVILCAMLSGLGSSIGRETESAAGFAGGLCLLLTVFQITTPVWELIRDTLSGIGTILKSALPVMTAVYAASGSLSASAVNATWLSVFLTLLEQLCQTVLPPLLSVCFGFMAVTTLSRFGGGPDMSGIVGSLRKGFTLLLTLMSAIFTAVMSYQSIVAKSADSVALRSLRFASGNMIPVIGGALGEAADSYLASVSLIRGAAGTLTATAVILYALPAAMRLIVCKLGLSAAATAAELLGCRREGAMLREAGELLGLALAPLAVCSAIMIVLLGIFAAGT